MDFTSPFGREPLTIARLQDIIGTVKQATTITIPQTQTLLNVLPKPIAQSAVLGSKINVYQNPLPIGPAFIETPDVGARIQSAGIKAQYNAQNAIVQPVADLSTWFKNGLLSVSGFTVAGGIGTAAVFGLGAYLLYKNRRKLSKLVGGML